MARIVFLNERAIYRPGLSSLIGYLKSGGHVCKLYFEELEKDFLELILDFKPDIVGFSCVSGEQKWSFRKARDIKARVNTISVFGGPHPTFFPDIIKEDGVDIVCRGEGEYPLMQLANKIDKNEDVSDIEGLWVKDSAGSVTKTEIGPLPDIENLPMPDFDSFFKYKNLADAPGKNFMVSRGCPYNCTYCINSAKKKLFMGKGKFIRYKPVESVIEEIQYVKAKYALDVVIFIDDCFTLKFDYLKEFLHEYKKHINLPFRCQVTADKVNEDIIKTLKENNCISIAFGLETGNEQRRKKILNKNILDEHIKNAANIIKKYKVMLTTQNIIGLPDETISDAIQTIKLNTEIKTDIMNLYTFQPYPGTPLAQYAISKGYIKEEELDAINLDALPAGTSILKMPHIRELCNLYLLFNVCKKFNFLIPLIKVLIKLPTNRLFYFVFNVSKAIEFNKYIKYRTQRFKWVRIYIDYFKSFIKKVVRYNKYVR
jgi:radical SAM superfamily enzyme YgiQ (UPF0313 family)